MLHCSVPPPWTFMEEKLWQMKPKKRQLVNCNFYFQVCYFWAFFFNESSLISIIPRIPYTILTNKEWAYCTWTGWHELELISGLLNFILNNYWWMRLSILWRIIEIENGVIRRVRRPRRITPSEISTILHMMRQPNSIIVLLFIQNNS